MQKRKKQNRAISKMNRLLELPQEVTSNIPKITILGFQKMLIENYKTILEYQDFYIRISTYIGVLNVNGYNLNLQEMTTDDLLITGKIEETKFEPTVDE